MEKRTLEQVLADWREDAQVLRKHGNSQIADSIDSLCDAVSDSAEDYITWLSETEARMRSNRSGEWLRRRFPEWAAQGHARLNGRRREYRQVVIPQRGHISAVAEEGRRAAEEAA